MLPKTDESQKVPESVSGHEELGRTSKWCMVAALFYSEHSKCFLLQAHTDTEVDRLGTNLPTGRKPLLSHSHLVLVGLFLVTQESTFHSETFAYCWLHGTK